MSFAAHLAFSVEHAGELPPLYPVLRRYPNTDLPDPGQAAREALETSTLAARLPLDGRVALAVGSRGIHGIAEIVRAAATWFHGHGTTPFIVPAMGSHGGGDAGEQVKILAELGITEEYTGCAVCPGMDVVEVGTTPEGVPAFVDARALGADGIFVINRVKPHTAFRGQHESGLVKMLVIGLGKQRGAEACHTRGFPAMPDLLPQLARITLNAAPVLGGLGIVENAYDRTMHIQAATAQELFACDAALLERARAAMPSLPMRELDILLVDEMGKNISGAGMDCAITGRYAAPGLSGTLRVNKLVVLDLTPESKGNAVGIGHADITTARLVDSIDFHATYVNAVTATLLKPIFLPLVAATDRDALHCALQTCNAAGTPPRMARIRNTLTPHQMLVSAPVAEELQERNDCSVRDTPILPRFAANGTLLNTKDWEKWFASF